VIINSSKIWSRYAIIFIKLIFVPSAIGWLVTQLINDPRIGLLKLTPSMLVAGLLVNQIALSLFALRMQLVLGIFRIKISQMQSLRIHLQSMFYFFALPMTVGLEAARFAKIKNIVGEQTQAVTLGSALLADRLIGALAALLLATLLLPFMEFRLLAQWDMRTSLMVFIGGCVLIFLMSLHGKIRSYVREIVKLFLSGWKELWVAIIVSISTHLLFASGIYLASLGAHLQITFLQTLFVISAAMLFVILPVSFAGISPVEAAGLGVLLGLGLSIEQAAVFVFISFAAKLIAAFEGGMWEIYEGGEYVSRCFLKVRKEKS